MRIIDALYYLLLGFLTLAMLTMLALWVGTKQMVYLAFMLAILAVYAFFIVLTLLRDARDFRVGSPFRSRFLMLLRHNDSKIVYLAYLGNERRAKKPSLSRKDFLVEFYEPKADLEQLKSHAYYGLSDEGERELERSFIGGMDVPFLFLSDIRGKTVLVPDAFLDLVENLPKYADFLNQNKIIPYGETHD